MSRQNNAEFNQCVTAFHSVLSSAGTAGFHAYDFVRIYSLFHTLAARYARQVFDELEAYGHSPSREARENWVAGVPLFASVFFVTLVCKLLNPLLERKYNRYIATQDYVTSLFSSSIIFFIGDLFSKTGRMSVLPPWAFGLISSLGVLSSMALFFKITSPDSANRSLLSIDEATGLRRFHALSIGYPDVTRFERAMNSISGLSYASALSLFFCVMDREIYNGTVASPDWQKVVLGSLVPISMVFAAWAVTDKPTGFHALVAASKAIMAGASTYMTLSGMAYYLIKYSDPNKQFQPSKSTLLILTALCLLASFSVTAFSGLMTHFAFSKNRAGNQGLEKTVRALPSTLERGVSATKDAVVSAAHNVWSLFRTCGHYCSSRCCLKKRVAMEETTSLVSSNIFNV